jgi:hypothetical protein
MRFILFYKLHLSFRNFFLPKMGWYHSTTPP